MPIHHVPAQNQYINLLDPPLPDPPPPLSPTEKGDIFCVFKQSLDSYVMMLKSR